MQHFFPQWRQLPGRYHAAAAEMLEPILNAPGVETEVFCVPNDTAVDVAPNAPFEGRIQLREGSRLFALAGYSAQADGFDVQIKDAGTGASLFQSRVHFGNCTVQDQVSPITSQQFVLPKPLLISNSGLLLVQIFNQASVQNTIQLALFIATKRGQKP